jgi:hypothetical protein
MEISMAVPEKTKKRTAILTLSFQAYTQRNERKSWTKLSVCNLQN